MWEFGEVKYSVGEDRGEKACKKGREEIGAKASEKEEKKSKEVEFVQYGLLDHNGP